MTTSVKIVGYTPNEHGVFVHAISNSRVYNHFGEKTYCEFVTDKHLKKHNLERYELIGRDATYYAYMDNNVLHKGITLKI